jgi:drug/metabolite transporter (DMT)-like permease
MSELTNRPGKPIRRPDIRNIIGALLATYGVILVVTGLLGDADTDKTGGVNANLWAGVGLLVVGGAFLAWARLKPLLVPETTSDTTEEAPGAPPAQGGSTAE